MAGGILYEHGHRLAALSVATLTASTCALVWKYRRDGHLRALATLAVALVALQAALGAITVVFKLPLLVSTSHLATAMAFFALIIFLAFRLRPAQPGSRLPRGWLKAALGFTYGQMILGAFVRHTSSALACNVKLPLCNGMLWPEGGPAQLHMAHRLAGVAVALLIFAASLRARRAALQGGRPNAARFALVPPLLVLVQIALGALTVTSFVAVPLTTAHVAGGALLWASLWSLFFALGPLGATRPSATSAVRRATSPAEAL
jgi:heme A synthase